LVSATHEAWNAGLIARLNDLRIDVPDPDVRADRAIDAVRRFGFALISGFGEAALRASAAAELSALAKRFGRIVPQSPRGERIEDVRDYSDVEEKDERGYRSGGELSPHSDPSTLIALRCLKLAKSGGESHLVNVRAVHDRIAAHDPVLLATLYRDFPQWQVAGQYGEAAAGPAVCGRPIFAKRNDVVSCVLYRPFVEMGAEALNMPLSAKQTAALDLFDACASDPDLTLRFVLQPGETLVLNNRTVLHARTDYKDWPDQNRRRHLLRVWIDAPAQFPVAPEHALGDLFAPRPVS
jgi:hypothetical protein